MTNKVIDLMKKIAKSTSDDDKLLSEGLVEAIESIESRRAEFDQKKQQVEEDIKNGARLTKHRFTL